jgi:hypothetical protein
VKLEVSAPGEDAVHSRRGVEDRSWIAEPAANRMLPVERLDRPAVRSLCFDATGSARVRRRLAQSARNEGGRNGKSDEGAAPCAAD